jgi:hemerythrin superfamily protein
MASEEREDVVAVLLRQHEQIRRLFEDVESSQGKQRAELFEQLKRLLAVHEAAEEQIVHPTARDHLPDGEQVAAARIAEEEAAKAMLSQLEELGSDHPAFEEIFKELRKNVLKHAEAEETKEFPGVRTSHTSEQLAKMGQALKQAEKLAPTHPHPADADTPPANIVAGPITAIADKARDLVKSAMK